MKKVLFIALSTVLFSCVNNDYDDIQNTNGDISLKGMQLVAPLGTINCNVDDVMKRFDVKEMSINKDTLAAIYKKDYDFAIPEEFINIQNSPFSFDAGSGKNFEKNCNYIIAFAPSGWEIDRLNAENTTLHIEVNSKISTKATLKLTFQNGPTFEQNIDIDVQNGTTTKDIAVVPLSIFKLKKKPTILFNQFVLPFKAELITENSTTIEKDDITFSLKFTDFFPKIVWGNFENISFEKTDDITLKLMNHISSQSKIAFKNPTITCDITSFIGTPTVMHINELYAKQKNGEGRRYADFNGNKSYDINIDASPSIYDSVQKTVVFDDKLGKIDQFITLDFLPNKIYYNFTLGAKNTEQEQFFDASKIFRFGIKVRIPFVLDGKSSMISEDTLKLDLSGIEQDKVKIKQIVFRTQVENGIPVNIDVQLTMLDKDYKPLPEIPTKTRTVKAAPSDIHGKAIGTTKDEIYLTFEEDELDDVNKIAYIKVETLSRGGEGNEEIWLESTYSAQIKTDIFAKFDLNF